MGSRLGIDPVTTLNLGVYDIEYAATFRAELARGRGKKRTLSAALQSYAGSKTTGQVAEWLENRYGIMRTFYEHESGRVVIPAIEHAVRGALIDILNGRTGVINVPDRAMQIIKAAFDESLSLRKYDQWIGPPRVPTKPAQGFVKHRHKDLGKAARRKDIAAGGQGVRPSFIDTGLYQTSFRAWMS
jgi:hypothetical protein